MPNHSSANRPIVIVVMYTCKCASIKCMVTVLETVTMCKTIRLRTLEKGAFFTLFNSQKQKRLIPSNIFLF